MAVNFVQTSNIRNLGGKAVNDGVRLGDAAISKVGFFGADPVVQQAAIVSAAATATDAATAINAVLDVLRTYGLIAS